MNNVTGQNRDNFLLHVIDTRRNEKWLVDGGALLSIVPPTPWQLKQGPVGDDLRAANGSKIPCYGTIYRTLSIGGKEFPFEFTVAAVSQRILGADFLANFYLAPNHRDAQLLCLKDYSTLPAQHAPDAISTPVNFISHSQDPCYKLLDSYPDILTPSFKIKDPEHGVRHHIPTEGFPVQSKARRLDQEKLAVAKAELNKLEALGICYRGRSEWASPLLVTTKPCGGWRVCGDYRRLNAMTKDDQYPVRQLTDFTSELHGKSIFSKIDLLKGYHQIPVADNDVPKTAVITPFGLYIFPRCPFGLKNAGQDFQRLMDEILGDIPRVFVYIDDILVASESLEQHLLDLDVVFKTLSANGMVVQRSKCILGKSSLEFLGYQVDTTGISPLKDRVSAIEKTTPPTSIKELQRFLGMVGYYRRFIPNAAQHLFYLFEALKGKPKTLEWTTDCQKSFDATKAALAAATLLHHPRPGTQLALTTDASNSAIGGVLEQRGPHGWEPLAFWSAKLEPNQQQWPPYDRELLAAFRGCRHFRSWIEGRPFTLYTDHQSLVPSIHKKTDPQTLRQTYQLSCVAEYTTDVRYVEGKANLVADALSRPNELLPVIASISQETASSRQEKLPTISCLDRLFAYPTTTESIFRAWETATTSSKPSSSTSSTAPAAVDSNSQTDQPTTSSDPSGAFKEVPDPPESINAAHRAASAAKSEAAASDLNCVVNSIGDLGIDWDEVASQQPLDPEFLRLRNNARSGLNFKSISIGTRQIIVDLSNGPARPYIPFACRRKVFDRFHGLGHPGVERTRQMIAAKVVWPSMRQDVGKWAKECLACQQSKVTKHTVPPIGDFVVPDRRFQHINIDLVTLPRSNGFKYLLTAVDRFTRWPMAVPLVDMSTESVVDALAFGWIQHFGVPSTITSDQGAQFTSDMFKQLTQTWGIKVITTTPYHPEANGLVERFHRRLKEALIALGTENPHEWFWRLPCVMLSIRTTLKPDVGASPAELVYGKGLAVPGELLPANPSADSQLLRQRVSALSDLRLEVARLQPVQTSAHRRPLVHLPEGLDNCTHVFVRRGDNGIHPSLAAPYIGPFRVIARNSVNFKIAVPGRSHETVAIARVKPAYSALQDAEDAAPPPRTPSGRRPRRRRRSPRTQTVNDEPQSPPIRTRIPRGRARPLPSNDEDLQPPVEQHPPPADDPMSFPLDYDVPVDEIPEFHPPAWFDNDAHLDWGAEPEAEAPQAPSAPPSPFHTSPTPRQPSPQPSTSPRPNPSQRLFSPPAPPPPPRRKKRKCGNPNWVKGGSFKGSYSRDRRPDVSVIFAHLGLPVPSTTLSTTHECNSDCDNAFSPD